MRKKRPERIRTIIEKLLRDNEWETHLKELQPLIHWQEVVGPQIARQAQPESLKDGVLQVRVQNSVWLSHLRFLSEELRGKLNRELSSQTIKEIRFRQGPIDQLPVAPPPVSPKHVSNLPRSGKTSLALTSEQESLLAEIIDPELRRSLENLLRKQKAGRGSESEEH